MDIRIVCRNIESVRRYCEIEEREMARLCACTDNVYRNIQNERFPRGESEDVVLYCFCSHFNLHLLDLFSPLNEVHYITAQKAHLGISDILIFKKTCPNPCDET